MYLHSGLENKAIEKRSKERKSTNILLQYWTTNNFKILKSVI